KQQEKRRGTSRGCKREEGTLIHMFWSCPCVVPFWKSITEHLSNITNVNIPLSPRLMILGDTSVCKLSKVIAKMILSSALIGKKNILLATSL
uniref:Uncharacterized protein n=1 Tax=Astyanax mexicanus TaxID=7994 RepID=A0A8B9JFG8_ASTMX